MTKESKSLQYRRDTRTEEEFEKLIKQRTLKEEFLAKLFISEMTVLGREAEYRVLGNVDAGEVKKTTDCQADYEFIVSGKTFKADIKNCYIDRKGTFKTYDLEQYIKQGAYIVCFFGTGKIDEDPTTIQYEKTKWTLISPASMQLMLDELPHYKDKAFGYKMCIQVRANEFDRFFTLHELKFRPET